MYQFKSRVRYSEINSEQQLTLSALLDYLQDCCTFESEGAGRVGLILVGDPDCEISEDGRRNLRWYMAI